MENQFRQIVAAGLRRRSVRKCSSWARRYRVAGGTTSPGPWSFDWHPWSKEMHDTDAPFCAGMKAAQMSYTETMLNRVFFCMDIRVVNTMYILPNQRPDAADFSASRFDPALELSEHIRSMYSDVKNVGHKRAGAANLWIRGSQARGPLKSVDPAELILDEVDEMNQENIDLAMERVSGQLISQIWGISTPTVPGYGIHKLYLTTTQEHFFFPCPKCGQQTELLFPECLVITADDKLDPNIKNSHVICIRCKRKIDSEITNRTSEKKEAMQRGEWQPTENPDLRDTRRGFYVNQLYSNTVKPSEIAYKFLKAKEGDVHAEQEVWNSKAGLPHIVRSIQVNDEDIDKLKKQSNGYRLTTGKPTGKLRTMGADVGHPQIHIEIASWDFDRFGPDLNFNAKANVLWVGTVEHDYELHNLMRDWQLHAAVIDIEPEIRMAYDFCCRFPGHVHRCKFQANVGSKKLQSDEAEYKISANRSFWLDTALGRVKSGRMSLPVDTPKEYGAHLKAVIKKPMGASDMAVMKKASTDKQTASKSLYISRGADHFAFARTYNEMALLMAASHQTNRPIKSFL